MSIDKLSASTTISTTGAIVAFGGLSAPSEWLLCDGSAVSRTTYSGLFNVLNPSKGIFTITIASPGVVTLINHGFIDGDAVFLTTSGALPTGLSANTIYYVKSPTSNSFNLSSTRDGTTGAAGTAINTSGTQSGTHTLYHCAFGLGDGSTTFNVPDLRGRMPTGSDRIGGSSASVLTVAGAVGFGSGAATHTLTTAELPAHSHPVTDPTHGHGVWTGGTAYSNGALNGGAVTDLGGATDAQLSNITVQNNTTTGSAHNNMQPYRLTSYIIKT